MNEQDIRNILHERTYEGYLKVDAYRLEHRRFDGSWMGEIRREIVRRGPAVAVMLYDPQRDAVVLIQQFRIGAYLAKRSSPWMTEIVAGLVEKGEDPAAVARRETLEEAGCEILDLVPLYDYIVSPGCIDETVTMFCGRVDSSKAGGDHGLAHEGEDIRVVVKTFDEAWTELHAGGLDTSIAVIGMLWLKVNREALRRRWALTAPSKDPSPRRLIASAIPPKLPAMDIRTDSIDAIGRTPLIRLKAASELTGCTILGKAEFLNPGGSVKDRAALFIIKDAEERGLLKPGGVIVEGTAGNTGIGIALVANARGYRSVIVIPNTQSQEKKEMLRLCGADLREVPAVPYANPNNYVKVSGRLAEEIGKKEPAGAIWANQFDNVANRRAHLETTGPEIWEQTDGKIDGFVSAVGTGGTLAGMSLFLKQKNPKIRIALADPMGAALYSYYKTGQLKSEGSSITEGIGQGRITKNLEGIVVDDAFQIPDSEAVPIIFDLLKNEGLFLGGSTGINVAGAIRLARQLGPGHTIVTLLCDGGQRYASKLFNPEFLRSKNLPVPDWLEGKGTIPVATPLVPV